MDNKEYNTLRTSFNAPSFKMILKDNIGHICVNCNSDIDIEYHHIVPLSMGGTNRLSNIVPLCHRCHMAAHHGRHMSHYRKKAKKTGRKRKVNLNENTEQILWRFAKGEVGESDCKKLLGMGKYTRLKDSMVYKEFAKNNNILAIKNRRDTLRRFYDDYTGVVVSIITKTDDTKQTYYGS